VLSFLALLFLFETLEKFDRFSDFRQYFICFLLAFLKSSNLPNNRVKPSLFGSQLSLHVMVILLLIKIILQKMALLNPLNPKKSLQLLLLSEQGHRLSSAGSQILCEHGPVLGKQAGFQLEVSAGLSLGFELLVELLVEAGFDAKLLGYRVQFGVGAGFFGA
jgi:hypothetical protein